MMEGRELQFFAQIFCNHCDFYVWIDVTKNNISYSYSYFILKTKYNVLYDLKESHIQTCSNLRKVNFLEKLLGGGFWVK